MTLPNYNAISFHSKEEHLSHLYDACILIVNTYNQSDVLDGVTMDNYRGGICAYDFKKFARKVANQIAEGKLK